MNRLLRRLFYCPLGFHRRSGRHVKERLTQRSGYAYTSICTCCRRELYKTGSGRWVRLREDK